MSKSSRPRVLRWSAMMLGAVFFAAPVIAQEQPREGRGGNDAERQQRFEQFRQQMDTRMKEVLRASDEEYAVLKPRIEKIQQLLRANDTRRAGFSMLTSNANWRTRQSNPGEGQRQPNTGQGEQNQPERRSPFGETPTTPLTAKVQEMQAALEAKDAGNDTLKSKLAELRAARQQARQELSSLQEELRQLCSVRQESVLVVLGVLE